MNCLQELFGSTKSTCIRLVLQFDKVLSQLLYRSMSGGLCTLKQLKYVSTLLLLMYSWFYQLRLACRQCYTITNRSRGQYIKSGNLHNTIPHPQLHKRTACLLACRDNLAGISRGKSTLNLKCYASLGTNNNSAETIKTRRHYGQYKVMLQYSSH